MIREDGKAYFAEVDIEGNILNVSVAALEWPHITPGQFVRLNSKARPKGTYNFETGVFEE